MFAQLAQLHKVNLKNRFMENYKKRLIKEQEELDEKLSELNNFNDSKKAESIDADIKSLLLVQAGAMYTYNECMKAVISKL